MCQILRFSVMCKQEKLLSNRRRKIYSLPEKQQMISAYYQSGLSQKGFARAHQIPSTTLRFWLNSCESAEKSVSLQSKSLSMDAKSEMLDKLRAENEKLRHNLEFERLRVRAYERLIEIVKEEDGIDVLKKDGAKQ